MYVCVADGVVFFVEVSFAENETENLTFKNSGLYGGWNEYFVSKDAPFDFLIVQCWVGEKDEQWHGKGKGDNTWNNWLKRAYANGKKTIMVLNPRAKKGGKGEEVDLQHAYHGSAPSVEEYAKVIDDFLATVDLDKLYAITLAEEGVFWSGQAERLNYLYDYIKTHYPQVSVYQWYSPGSGVPGMGWPNLKADGWLIDEYFLDPPKFEYFVRGYTIRRLPLVHIIWAGPDCKGVPYKERRFWAQYEVCRKYNIPTAYFAWTGKSNIWGWSKNPPVATKRVFELCKYAANLAKECSAKCRDWDSVPVKPRTISLTCEADGKPFASYTEKFNRNKGVRFLRDARITGFANLRWNSSPLELWAPKPGKLAASLIYQFRSPFPLKSIQVSLQGQTKKEHNGKVEVSIIDANGKTIAKFPLEGNEIKQSVSGDKIEGGQFAIEIKLTGQANKEKQVPAEISELTVTGELELPKTKQIVLEPDAFGNIEYTDNFDSLSILHTAEIKNRKRLIVSAGVLQAAGVAGRGNNIEVIQKVFSVKPIKLVNISVKGSGDESNFGSTFRIGISLDGKTMLKDVRSSGKGDKPLTIDLADVPTLSNVKEFYIHLGLSVGCGVKTNPVCSIGEYTIKGKTVDNTTPGK